MTIGEETIVAILVIATAETIVTVVETKIDQTIALVHQQVAVVNGHAAHGGHVHVADLEVLLVEEFVLLPGTMSPCRKCRSTSPIVTFTT